VRAAGGIESGAGWVVERGAEVPKEEGRRPYSALPFSKSHSSEADGHTAPFRSSPPYSTPLCARGRGWYTVHRRRCSTREKV